MPPQHFELTAFAVASCPRNESGMKGLFFIFYFIATSIHMDSVRLIFRN